jgi:hypothetical protein
MRTKAFALTWTLRASAGGLMLSLAACSLPSKSPMPPSSGLPSRGAEAHRQAESKSIPNLGAEQRWLDAWFRGTPVVVAQNDDGDLIIEVPQAYCFESGRTQMRPALLAVIDKVSQSLRRTPSARVTRLAAPEERGGASLLANQRAAELHKRLMEHGVKAARLAEPTTTLAKAVQLRIGLAE